MRRSSRSRDRWAALGTPRLTSHPRLAAADGDLDLLTSALYLYDNDGQGNLASNPTVRATFSEEDILVKTVVFFDWDGDGDLDLFAAGYVGYGGATDNARAYRNDGSGSFAAASGTTATIVGSHVSNGQVSFGDFDGDGASRLALPHALNANAH